MIIVSQDKTVIVNFDNTEALEIGNIEENNGKAVIYVRLSNYFYKLGSYETEERAKEVLEAIYNFYEIAKRYECSSNNGVTIFLENKFTYKMPEE